MERGVARICSLKMFIHQQMDPVNFFPLLAPQADTLTESLTNWKAEQQAVILRPSKPKHRAHLLKGAELFNQYSGHGQG